MIAFNFQLLFPLSPLLISLLRRHYYFYLASISSMGAVRTVFKYGTSFAVSTVRWFSRILSQQRPCPQLDPLEQPSSLQLVPLKQPCSPQLGRLAIPPELILMITQHLGKPSLLCFALTCRTINRNCFPKHLDLSSSDKEQFLLLLEKDTPKHYFCHFCVKLHPWRDCWFQSDRDRYICRDFYARDADHCKMKNWIFDFSLTLPYPLARVVMNRHLYGEAHGVPVEKLTTRGEVESLCYNLRYSRAWDARIIDDQLMLSSVITLTPLRDTKGLRESIDTGLASLCRHLTTGRVSRRTTGRVSYRHQIPELAISRPEYFIPCHQSIKSCPICMTDYCIDITWQGKGWDIKIITYHLLGDARSPRDWTWVAMVRFPDEAINAPRIKQSSGNQPGIVRHMWSKADELVLEPKGDWAESPEWHPKFYSFHRLSSMGDALSQPR